DINVMLNNNTRINLEMQVMNYHNWPERAMTYLCRNFDQLRSGENYIRVKPTIHIGFLDFSLFPDCLEFYATYKMMNVRNHRIFTDKLVLSVVDLTHMELATQEDREWKIDYWAALFKATTWEELKMLADKSQILQDAVETIYDLTADEAIREQCKAREKYIKEMSTVLEEREMAYQEREMAYQEREMAYQERDAAYRERDAVCQKLEESLQQGKQKAQIITQQFQQIEQMRQEIERLKGRQ
ncbi:MAG: PD-(D/E)XK nuclease family transposase, partial [Acetatifactor sp.]|nr:PD-(D/E)XK nuclease family transposase [Acetatifactor sp.]